MKNRDSRYRPPAVTAAFPAYERGYYIGCPSASGRKTSVAEGKLKIRKDDNLRTRFSCLIGKEDCNLCPNHDFAATFQVIGKNEDFLWLTDLMKTACKIADAKIANMRRWRDDCCLKHANCIMVRYEVRTKEGAIFDKDTGELIYNTIMKGGEASKFDVLHVKVEKRDQRLFRFDIAMVPRGDESWKPKKRKEDVREKVDQEQEGEIDAEEREEREDR